MVDADIFRDPNPYGTEQAIQKNMDVLIEGILPDGALGKLKPERIISFEIGYKTKLLERFFIDAVYYNSIYQDFIGLVEVVKPRTSPTVDLFTAAHQVNNSSQNELIFVYTNAQENVMIQGISVGAKYLFPVGAVLSGNATWSDLSSNPKDPIIPGFNTPGFKANVSISNRRLDQLENNPGFDKVGFSLAWRYQSGINWESPYASGWLEPNNSWDLQVSYTFISPRSILKAGVSNFFNILYTNSFGGAQVGAFYYISYSIEDLFNF
jgi:outer membrane receptor protein involved in Fe transport